MQTCHWLNCKDIKDLARFSNVVFLVSLHSCLSLYLPFCISCGLSMSIPTISNLRTGRVSTLCGLLVPVSSRIGKAMYKSRRLYRRALFHIIHKTFWVWDWNGFLTLLLSHPCNLQRAQTEINLENKLKNKIVWDFIPSFSFWDINLSPLPLLPLMHI